MRGHLRTICSQHSRKRKVEPVLGGGTLMRRIRTAAAIMIFLLVALSAAGCGGGKESGAGDGKIHVIATFYPLYDFASKIGGEHVHVDNLVPAGVEPHDWSPKPREMAAIADAQVFVYNGLGLEGWVDDFLRGLDNESELVVVEASQGIEPIAGDVDGEAAEEVHFEHEHELDQEHEHENEHAHENELDHENEHAHDHDHRALDPHVWLSPLRAKQMAANIRDGLIQADPQHKDDYEANYAQLSSELERLHQEFEETLSSAPKRQIVTSHHAYGYLSRDYGLEQLAVLGINPESEPTPQAMKRVIQFIQEHDVRYILFDQLESSKLAETMARESGVETLPFHSLEVLTEEQEKNGEDYFSMMRKNMETLAIALQ
jgi:zinc transport system substrate-binding protein